MKQLTQSSFTCRFFSLLRSYSANKSKNIYKFCTVSVSEGGSEVQKDPSNRNDEISEENDQKNDDTDDDDEGVISKSILICKGLHCMSVVPLFTPS